MRSEYVYRILSNSAVQIRYEDLTEETVTSRLTCIIFVSVLC
jgi:hypothetical protein